jgi:hypothetical protein
MPENGLLDASTPSIRRAVELLVGVFDALVDPAHWCRGALACDREGEPIDGPILEVVAGVATSRCLLGELLHQGLTRGYEIEIASVDYLGGQVPIEITRAPASWMVGGSAVAFVERSLNPQRARRADKLRAKHSSLQPITPGQAVLRLAVWNDNSSGGHDEVISCVALAVQMLRAELDRRAQE